MEEDGQHYRNLVAHSYAKKIAKGGNKIWKLMIT